MSAPTYSNVASDDAHVDLQVGVLHLDIDYQVPPDASPEELFRIGVRYLEARMPREAREFIEKAAARGHDSDEVHFYRMLALLTGRTLTQLDGDEFTRLGAILESIERRAGRDDWRAGIRAIVMLVDGARRQDTEGAVKEIEELPPTQRNLILKHLGVLRDGPVEDRMWRLSVEQARAGQTANDRAERVWAFFEPVPAGPRARHPRPAAAAPIDWLRAVGGGIIFAFAAFRIGSLAMHGDATAILGGAVAVAGLLAFLVNGSDWHFRLRRVQAKDAQIRAARHAEEPGGDGFARRVGRMVDDCFRRYVPKETDRSLWLDKTAGIRQAMRDELVEIYREQPVKPHQIAWLVRHLVGDVRTRWEKRTLLAYRRQWRPPAQVKLACLLGLAVLGAAGFWIVPAVWDRAPIAGAAWLLIAVVSAGFATPSGFRIDAERRRVNADQDEYDRHLRARQQAHQRWLRKLACKPSDAEMAEWLECDRRILVDETMRYYRLRPGQVIAHAFIEAPGRYAKKARIPRGPWRYSRYRMLLFLLTGEGVRQVTIDLDFEEGDSRRTQRLNYRFDTVAAVRVEGAEGQRQTFELTLFNGEPVRVPVSVPADDEMPADEDEASVSRLALDASGLPQTFDVLEGIAAEGKEWIQGKRNRTRDRLNDLAATIRDLLE
ncbi:hypothetical protein BJY16_008569 [Actinoplanes octamycinicus]|uniref:Uncharacterized protein n=1 Tax=Actinoplanes octamycinicus TaxID=135948 RepID=A0A7W7MCT2_9ACTN|nr:hypothetical protein [Actinoplanes octamycinicus]MBB4745110.1 hypothetical protein [Actinoplanes octamycinicus]GIE55694.1 hypothetical protein Aoc01nite_10960 [Actinoplanes octamycinicus]